MVLERARAQRQVCVSVALCTVRMWGVLRLPTMDFIRKPIRVETCGTALVDVPGVQVRGRSLGMDRCRPL
jgi:hypothetical protein